MADCVKNKPILLETVPTLLKAYSFHQTLVFKYFVRCALSKLPAHTDVIRLRSDSSVREFRWY